MSCEVAQKFEGIGKEVFQIGRKCGITLIYCQNWEQPGLVAHCPVLKNFDKSMLKKKVKKCA